LVFLSRSLLLRCSITPEVHKKQTFEEFSLLEPGQSQAKQNRSLGRQQAEPSRFCLLHIGLFLSLLFDAEEGGETFLRNVQ
jgi:hypothetical protein